MIKNISILLSVFTFVAINASASTYIVCGKSVNSNLDVQGFELAVSSEGGDDYNWPVSTNWDMVLEDINDGWMAYSPNITAQKIKEGSLTVVEIQIVNGNFVTGAVGFLYRIIGLYEDSPKLEKYNIGGFTGQLMIDDDFECASSNI